MKLLRVLTRSLAITVVVLLGQIVLAVGASAAQPAATTKTLGTHPISAEVCNSIHADVAHYLQTHKGSEALHGIAKGAPGDCHHTLTVTTTAPTATPVAFGVTQAAAWSGCEWTTFTDNIWSGWWWIGSGYLRVGNCWNDWQVWVFAGPNCWTSSAYPYGGGINWCYTANNWGNPLYAELGWYLYPYGTPWYHRNSCQEGTIWASGGQLWAYDYC